MFIESRIAAFQPLDSSVDTYGVLNEILGEIFNPKTAFSPPPEAGMFQLGQLQGAPIVEILSEVRTKVVAHAINSRHKWTLAHMVPPPATISVIADLLIGALNQCAFIWEEAPLAAALETETVCWLARRIGYGEQAGGLLTSGGTMSNCLAVYLALARAQTRLTKDRDRYCIIASDQAHFSIQKTVALTGLPPTSVIRVQTDKHGRLRPGQIEAAAASAREAGRVPFLFVCTAGTTNTGVLESAEEFLEGARSYGAWCHIDAAHGGIARLSKPPHPATSQWADADSVSWDPHKSLYVSYAVGALLLQDETTRTPLEFHSEYALKDDNEAHAGAWHLDGSRRFEALKLWMTIKHLGLGGFADIVDHCLMLAKELAARIRSMRDFALVTEPDTNIVCFRFVDRNMSNAELDTINTAVQKQLFQNGGPLISTTRVGGHIVLRAVLLNPLLEIEDLSDVLGAIRAEAYRQALLAAHIKEEQHEDIACHKSTSGS